MVHQKATPYLLQVMLNAVRIAEHLLKYFCQKRTLFMNFSDVVPGVTPRSSDHELSTSRGMTSAAWQRVSEEAKATVSPAG